MSDTPKALAEAGTVEDQIPGQIKLPNHRAVLGRAGPSPNKAVEELVANWYDAMATHVHVLVPANLSAPQATIWVADDGTGMDLPGLFELW